MFKKCRGEGGVCVIGVVLGGLPGGLPGGLSVVVVCTNISCDHRSTASDVIQTFHVIKLTNINPILTTLMLQNWFSCPRQPSDL